MLRAAVAALAVLMFIAAIVIGIVFPWIWPASVELGIFGVFILLGLFFDRYRKRTASSGPWQSTGERFRDPVSGEMVDVRYNPQTGERDYHQEP